MLMAFTGPILLTNMSAWITVGLTVKSSGEKQGERKISSVISEYIQKTFIKVTTM